MSTITPAAAPLEFYARALPADLDVNEIEGTAEGLLVPYGRETPIVEAHPGGLIRYTESFAAGSCQRAVRGGPGRLPLTYGHSNDFGNRLGFAAELRESAQGLVGKFRFDPSRRQEAYDAVTTTHGGLSVSFRSILPAGGQERDGQHVVRRSVHLIHVAAVPNPAYADAGFTVVRNQHDDLDDEPTDVEAAAAAQAAERKAALERALEMAQAGDRWAHLR